MRKGLATILMPAVLALSLAGCGVEPAPPLRIGTNVWSGYEPLYLARELGYLDPRSVHLVEYPSASEVIRAFRNHAIEAAALTFDEVLLLTPQDASARMAQREQLTGAQFLESLKGLQIPSRADNLRLLSGQHPPLAGSGRRLMQVMLDQRLLKTASDVEAIIAPGPLEELAP